MTFPSFFFQVYFRESRFGYPRIAQVISFEDLGTMSKNNLRAIAYKYRESHDRKENSGFLLLRQKHPFGELFSQMYFHFCEISEVRNTAQSTKMADGIYPKLYIFNTPVQKEGNLPGIHIYTVCNLPFGHSSELKVILAV